jgi:LMBR1 domain-containing protein 1
MRAMPVRKICTKFYIDDQYDSSYLLLCVAGCDGYDTSFCGGLNMELFWNVFFWLIPIWTFVLIPFSTFYYEADDGMLMAGTSVSPNPVRKSKLKQACCWQMGVFIVFGALFMLAYFLANEANIPVNEYNGAPLSLAELIGDGRGVVFTTSPEQNETSGEYPPFDEVLLDDMIPNDAAYTATVRNAGEQTLTLEVSISTFAAAFMAWIGWFLFALFGGIGMSAMPMDLILTYKNRPRHMDAVEFAEAQTSLRERVNELVDIGEMIKVEREANPGMGQIGGFGNFLNTDKRKEARNERQALLEFKQAVFLLEKDVDDFQACTSNYENYNPLTPYIAIVAGFFAAIISAFWMIHIVVYMFPSTPWAPFLNNYFEWFDNWFPLFGVLSVAIFTIYLLFAAIKGCFKFGLRVACVQLHPMIVGKTYMSSFMFNIGLVLLCALPVVQFAQDAFSEYARFSTIRQIFGVQAENLAFFGWWWQKNIFVYIFVALSFLSAVYLMCRPRDTPPSSAELRDRLRSRQA